MDFEEYRIRSTNGKRKKPILFTLFVIALVTIGVIGYPYFINKKEEVKEQEKIIDTEYGNDFYYDLELNYTKGYLPFDSIDTSTNLSFEVDVNNDGMWNNEEDRVDTYKINVSKNTVEFLNVNNYDDLKVYTAVSDIVAFKVLSTCDAPVGIIFMDISNNIYTSTYTKYGFALDKSIDELIYNITRLELKKELDKVLIKNNNESCKVEHFIYRSINNKYYDLFLKNQVFKSTDIYRYLFDNTLNTNYNVEGLFVTNEGKYVISPNNYNEQPLKYNNKELYYRGYFVGKKVNETDKKTYLIDYYNDLFEVGVNYKLTKIERIKDVNIPKCFDCNMIEIVNIDDNRITFEQVSDFEYLTKR